jgi:hypothetical protein
MVTVRIFPMTTLALVSVVLIAALQNPTDVNRGGTTAGMRGLHEMRRTIESVGLDPATEEGLAAALQNDDRMVRFAALHIMQHTADLSALTQIWPLVYDESPVVGPVALRAVGNICERETGLSPVDYYRERAEAANQAAFDASRILRSAGISTTETEVISTGITAPDETIRIAALTFLASNGSIDSIGPIVGSLETSSGATLAAAHRAIHTIARSNAIEVARQLYEAADVDAFRVHYASLLAHLGDPSEYWLVYEKASDPSSLEFEPAITKISTFATYDLREGGRPVDWEGLLEAVITNEEVPALTRKGALAGLMGISPEGARRFIAETMPKIMDDEVTEHMKLVAANYDRRKAQAQMTPRQDEPYEDDLVESRVQQTHDATANPNVTVEPRSDGDTAQNTGRATSTVPPATTPQTPATSVTERVSVTWIVIVVGTALVAAGYVTYKLRMR